MPRKAKPAAQATAAATAATGVQYWLLKTEPGEWSWSDQARAKGVAPWDGVRNHQAMKYLRAMRTGDRCLFYHSGAGASSRRVVGVVEVARTWYEEGEGDGKGKEAAGGGAVDVRAVGEFRSPVPLGEIKKAAAEVEGMRDFALLRQPRLSVMPVPAKVWDWICDAGGGFVQDGEAEEEEASCCNRQGCHPNCEGCILRSPFWPAMGSKLQSLHPLCSEGGWNQWYSVHLSSVFAISEPKSAKQGV